MINETVKAAQDNMAELINNIVRQVEGDTGMKVRTISVDRDGWTKGDYKVSMSLEVQNEVSE